MGVTERLDKILSSQNFGSRKDTAKLIRTGRVSVNGQRVTRPEAKADPGQDSITLDGKEIGYERRVYYMMNKPGGVLSAARDKHSKTVLDLLPPEYQRRGLFPAGRLDKDTQGLLLITDDGDFAHRMLSPKSGVRKIYHARLDAPIGAEDIRAFEQGVQLEDFQCLPAGLRVLDEGSEPLVEVTVCEGKFHQVKRMFAARGKQVTFLKRVQIGGLVLEETLALGETRKLTPQELERIFHP